jgi:MFS family permease
MVWGITQIATGTLSDKRGRKWMITAGMWVPAVGIWLTAAAAYVSANVRANALQHVRADQADDDN